jgi:broad specificity phosphatase PhoE
VVKIYVVRHAHAGSRSAWEGDDAERPLSKKGHRQAATIADHLVDVLPAPGSKTIRLVSSPAVRCQQTLGPLARRLGLQILQDVRLAEGRSGYDALELIDELRRHGPRTAVLSSHGDVIPELLGLLKIDGATFHDPFTWPKGSVWTLAGNGKSWTDARLWVPTS